MPGSPTTSDTGDAAIDWSKAALTEVDATAVIDDDQFGPLNSGNPIAWADLKAKPFTQVYELERTPVAGDCKDFDNTASVIGVDTEAVLDEATETVTLCDYKDLAVEKTATTASIQRYQNTASRVVSGRTR